MAKLPKEAVLEPKAKSSSRGICQIAWCKSMLTFYFKCVDMLVLVLVLVDELELRLVGQ